MCYPLGLYGDYRQMGFGIRVHIFPHCNVRFHLFCCSHLDKLLQRCLNISHFCTENSVGHIHPLQTHIGNNHYEHFQVPRIYIQMIALYLFHRYTEKGRGISAHTNQFLCWSYLMGTFPCKYHLLTTIRHDIFDKPVLPKWFYNRCNGGYRKSISVLSTTHAQLSWQCKSVTEHISRTRSRVSFRLPTHGLNHKMCSTSHQRCLSRMYPLPAILNRSLMDMSLM